MSQKSKSFPFRQMRNVLDGISFAIEKRLNLAGNSHMCYSCGKTFDHFYPYMNGYGSVSDYFRKLKVIGSDVDDFSCPACSSFHRERHLLMYFDRLDLWDLLKNQTVLHVAPEKHIKRRILELNPKEYIQGDLIPKSKDVQVIDVTRISFPRHYFDFIICNHVLEHVQDDTQALFELGRVLKLGGCAIMQTPYSSILTNSFIDGKIITPDLRREFYGEEDHVRVYGQDLFRKLEAAGFNLQIKQHKVVLPDYDSAYYGVNPDEDLILVTKS